MERWGGTGGVATAVATAGGRSAKPSATVANLPALVDRVAAELNLNLADPELQKRLRQIVLSRFKDVRDVIETREALLRPLAQGGLGQTAAAADTVTRLLERRYQDYGEKVRQEHDQERISIEANVGSVGGAVPGSVSSAADDAAASPRPLTPLPPQLAPQSPALPQPPAPRSTGVRSTENPVVPSTPPIDRISDFEFRIANRPSVPQPTAAVSSLPISPPLSAPPQVLPPVTGTERPRPKLIGPLEELQELTLTDFRQFDPDPVKAAHRIREKIMLLEQQSFGHKAAAIAAWRKSPVFSLYTRLAAGAMGAKLPLAQAIAQAESSGQEMLRVAEFEAVADLNRSLRF